MYTPSALYLRLLSDHRHIKEVKVTIAGTEYEPRALSVCAISGGEFKDFTIGECAAREIDLTVKPIAPIPRMAQIIVSYRLVLGAEASEWVPGGVFFVDTRKEDKATGWVALHGYDAMLKSEAVWWDPSVDAGEWPMPMTKAVADITRIMGVEVDPRTEINPAFKVEYPNNMTMREVLMNIAAAHIGNWRMTEEGKLLLVPLGLPGETNFLVDSLGGGAILFGDVRILV